MTYGINQLSNTTILENQNINHGVKFFKHFRQFSDTFLMKEPDPIPDPFDETHVAVHTLKKVVKSWQKWQILQPYKEFSFNSWSQMNISVEVDSFRTISRWVFSLGKSWFRKRLWFWARCDFFIVEILIFLWQYQNSVLIPGFASNQILDSWLENNNYFIVSGRILWFFGNFGVVMDTRIWCR